MLAAKALTMTGGSHWGVVLAAGDGTRLRNYVEQVFGHQLPKQFVNFIGRRSMIEHTFARTEKLISPRNVLTIVGKHHLRHAEVRRQLAARSAGTVIVQPANKETGPGILLPLMHIDKRRPDAIVSVFPSDHFILEEDRFMAHVELAARAVARNPGRIVLLAVEAHSPEEEYGYVVPAPHAGEIDLHGVRRVARFVEKPKGPAASELMNSGALWNTMVMVFHVRTMLRMIEAIAPQTYSHFTAISAALGTSDEQKTVEQVYGRLQPLNFSKDIVEKIAEVHPGAISVLPVVQVYWSDWGSPERLMASRNLLKLRHDRSDRISGARPAPKKLRQHEPPPLVREFGRATT